MTENDLQSFGQMTKGYFLGVFRSHFVKPTKMSLNNVVRVSSRAIVMDLRDVGVSDVLVSKIMFCVTIQAICQIIDKQNMKKTNKK
jgi:hypothetical protein